MMAAKSMWSMDKDAENRKKSRLEALIREKMKPVNEWTYVDKVGTTRDGTDLDKKIET